MPWEADPRVGDEAVVPLGVDMERGGIKEKDHDTFREENVGEGGECRQVPRAKPQQINRGGSCLRRRALNEDTAKSEPLNEPLRR